MQRTSASPPSINAALQQRLTASTMTAHQEFMLTPPPPKDKKRSCVALAHGDRIDVTPSQRPSSVSETDIKSKPDVEEASSGYEQQSGYKQQQSYFEYP